MRDPAGGNVEYGEVKSFIFDSVSCAVTGDVKFHHATAVIDGAVFYCAVFDGTVFSVSNMTCIVTSFALALEICELHCGHLMPHASRFEQWKQYTSRLHVVTCKSVFIITNW